MSLIGVGGFGQQNSGGIYPYPGVIPGSQQADYVPPPVCNTPWTLSIRKAENGYVVNHNGKDYVFKTLSEIARHFEPSDMAKEEA